MCEHCQHNASSLRKLLEKVSTMEKIILHNSGALIQPKWVNVETAKVITGMGRTWLLERQARAGSRYNEQGFFRTRLEGKEIVFYKKDLDAYEKYLAGEAPHPQAHTMRADLKIAS